MEGRAPQPDAPLPAGTRFGTYRVERLIGAGGMGSVYEALHVGLKKRVAIKILHSVFANNPEVVARFLREGEATTRINHPSVVDVTDLGLKDGVPYLVMELLIGENLAAILGREKVMSVERAVDVLLPMISAVGMAHDEGVVHRDLKPDNIFLAKNRLGTVEPKLLDFGISKMVTRSELTTAASVLGTPHYLSPEQAQALKDIDGRADQYSLAVILYRMVTGALPIGGGDAVLDVLIAVAQGRIRPPRAVRPELPELLERIILRGLATLPQDRYPHTHLFGFDLLPFASEEGRAMWRAHFSMRLGELGGDAKTQIMMAIDGPSSGVPVAGPGRPSAIPLGVPVVHPGSAPVPAASSAASPVAAVGPPHPGGGGPLVTPAKSVSPAVIVRSPGGPLSHGPGAPTVSPSVRIGAPPRPSVAPLAPPPTPGASAPASASVQSRALSDLDLTDVNATDGLGAREQFGTRISAGVLAAALIVAAAAIGGAILWSSSKEAPVTIPVSGERAIATYHLEVAVDPPEAEVWLDGEAKGRGPLKTELSLDGRDHTLEVRAPGYETQTVVFRESAPPSAVRLVKQP